MLMAVADGGGVTIQWMRVLFSLHLCSLFEWKHTLRWCHLQIHCCRC